MRAALAVSAFALIAALAACSKDKPAENTPSSIEAPAMPSPAAADGDMQAVLDQLAGMNGKPIESLTPAEARGQPTPADAVKGLMAAKSIKPPEDKTRVQNVTYPAGAGSQKARVYIPPAN